MLYPNWEKAMAIIIKQKKKKKSHVKRNDYNLLGIMWYYKIK